MRGNGEGSQSGGDDGVALKPHPHTHEDEAGSLGGLKWPLCPRWGHGVSESRRGPRGEKSRRGGWTERLRSGDVWTAASGRLLPPAPHPHHHGDKKSVGG
jgi:hypothetical protein